MEEHSTDRALDLFDQAAAVEEMHRAQALAAHRARTTVKETPDEDAEGNRYCLDCGDEIPRERIALLPDAVRCVVCAAKREARQRTAAAYGSRLSDVD